MDILKKYAPWLIAALALASAWYAWTHPKPGAVPSPQYIEVPVPKPYAVISKQTVTIETIKIITKTEIKEKWPAWFTGDPNQQLTAVGLIDPYRGKTECASIINIASGESRIVAKQLPIPLFGFENTKRVGVTYGIGFALDGEWAFVRVGNFYGSLKGLYAINSGTSVFVAGPSITYEW